MLPLPSSQQRRCRLDAEKGLGSRVAWETARDQRMPLVLYILEKVWSQGGRPNLRVDFGCKEVLSDTQVSRRPYGARNVGC